MSNENLSDGLESQFHEDYYGWPKTQCPLTQKKHCPDGTIFHNCMDCKLIPAKMTFMDWLIVLSLSGLVFALFLLFFFFMTS